MRDVTFNSNSSVLSVIKETKNGEVPKVGKALILQPNSIDTFGNSIETAARNPISTSRDAKKGAVVNLTSGVEAPQDLIISAYRMFSEGALCSFYDGLASHVMENVNFASGGFKTAGNVSINDLNSDKIVDIIASGFTNDDNNGQVTFSDGKVKVNGEDFVYEPGRGKLAVTAHEELTCGAIVEDNGEWYIETNDADKVPIASKIIIQGYTDAGNNGEFLVYDNVNDRIKLDNTLTWTADDLTSPTGNEKLIYIMEVTIENVGITKDGSLEWAAPWIYDGAIFVSSGYSNKENNGVWLIQNTELDSVTVVSLDRIMKEYKKGELIDKTAVDSTKRNTIVTEDVVLIESYARVPVAEKANGNQAFHFAGIQLGKNKISLAADGSIIIDKFSFEKLGLEVGQGIFIGGKTADTRFDYEPANGLARVCGIEEQTGSKYKIMLDKRNTPITDAIPNAGVDGMNKNIQLFIGEFIRTRETGDARYQEPSYCFELKTVNEENTNFYEYSVGNQINTMELGLSTNAIATMSLATVGRRTEDAMTEEEREQNLIQWTKLEPRFQEPFSTPSDVWRLRVTKVDEEGLTSAFTNATLSVNNNIGTESVIGHLGAFRTSLGRFSVTLTGTAIFMSHEVAKAITNNCTVSADVLLENADGGIWIDIPTMTLSDGSRDFTADEKIKQNITGTAYGDSNSRFNYSISCTIFYYLPTEKTDVC